MLIGMEAKMLLFIYFITLCDLDFTLSKRRNFCFLFYVDFCFGPLILYYCLNFDFFL